MTRSEQDMILRKNSASFIRNVCQVFKDMADVDLQVLHAGAGYSGLREHRRGMVVISHFSGMVQGDFMLSTDEETAAVIAGLNPADIHDKGLCEHREMYAGLMCEALNICVHQSIGDLEAQYGALTALPPAWIFGEYHSADFISGVGYVGGSCGYITCSLSLNMVSLKIIENMKSGMVG